MPDPLNPAQQAGGMPPGLMETLLGTLLQGQLTGLSQADLDRQNAETQAQVLKAQQAAQGAQQEYAQAQAQPAESPNNFYDQLAGNTASVLSGNQQYGERANARGKDKIRAVDDARLKNLQVLADAAEQKAQAADKLGQAEVAMKSRMSVEQYRAKIKALLQEDKQQQDEKNLNTRGQQASDLEKQRQGGRMDLQQLRGLQAVGVAKLKEEGKNISPEDEAWLQHAVVTTGRGHRFLRTGGLTGNLKNKAIKWALMNDMPALDKYDTKVAEDIQGARYNIEKMIAAIEQYLPQDPLSRMAGTANIKLSAITQNNAVRAAWPAWRTAAIKNLRATAGSGGLRINQKEIDLAVENDIIRDNDTIEAALKKMEFIRAMLDSAEDPLVRHDWRTDAPEPKSYVGPAAQKAAENKPTTHAPGSDPAGLGF